MRLEFLQVCDYAVIDKAGKLSVIGLFDTIGLVGTGEGPRRATRLFAVARLAADLSDGAEHHVRVAVVDEDGNPIVPPMEEKLTFVTQGRGRPLRGQVVLQADNLMFPRPGDFRIDIFVDGQHIGERLFHVMFVDSLSNA
jgi:hypothetical protein